MLPRTISKGIVLSCVILAHDCRSTNTIIVQLPQKTDAAWCQVFGVWRYLNKSHVCLRSFYKFSIFHGLFTLLFCISESIDKQKVGDVSRLPFRSMVLMFLKTKESIDTNSIFSLADIYVIKLEKYCIQYLNPILHIIGAP